MSAGEQQSQLSFHKIINHAFGRGTPTVPGLVGHVHGTSAHSEGVLQMELQVAEYLNVHIDLIFLALFNSTHSHQSYLNYKSHDTFLTQMGPRTC